MKLTRKYSTRTPVTVELISDVLLIISQGVVGYAISEHNEVLAWISMFTGLLGKILARFVEEGNVQERLDDSDISTNSTDIGDEPTER